VHWQRNGSYTRPLAIILEKKTDMRIFFMIILILFIWINCIAQSENKIDWKSDLEYLKKELPQKHTNLFFKMSQNEFISEINNLIQQVPYLSDYEVADRLLQHIAKIGDTHTSINFGRLNASDKLLPYNLYWFNDGLYILAVKQGFENLLGKKLIEINGFKIEQIVDSLSTLLPLDNSAGVKSSVPKIAGFLPHLIYFGFTNGGKIKLKIEDTDGNNSIVEISDTELKDNRWIGYEPDSIAFCWKNKGKYFVEQYFTDDSIYYLQYNICRSKEMEQRFGDRKKAKDLPSFIEFEKNVFNTIRNKPIKKFIVDLRFNGGGTSDQGTDFVNKLKDNKEINQKGKLFVITGKQTFSSGLVNVMDFKNKTQATFIGEETSGKPNHYGDVRFLTLPSSELRISYSTKYFKYSDKDMDSFEPDSVIETTFLDYKKGIDPVYEYIRKLK